MRTLGSAALLCLAAAFICGCASRHTAAPIHHSGDEIPPDFLGGPIATVLTNLNGFSAHVVSTRSAPGEQPQTTSGELLGRGGRLVFQPTLPIKDKKAQMAGGLLFIWDETTLSGYVLSEALQGYAPILPEVEAAGQVNITKEAVQQDVNGHPCHRCEADVMLSNGLKARLTLWQTDDATHFPVRIEATNGPNQMTLNFSEIRLESPSKDLFSPPDGFTAYASSVALMNELIIREATEAKMVQESKELHGNWTGTSGNPGASPVLH
jgi:hypothetical protein